MKNSLSTYCMLSHLLHITLLWMACKTLWLIHAFFNKVLNDVHCIVNPPTPPPPLNPGWWGVEPFFRRFMNFRWGWFFSGGTWKLAQTKKVILIVIYTISHFWSPTLTTLFSIVYTALSTNKYFFCRGSYLLARNWENFKFLGDLISILGGETLPFSTIKPSMTNYINSRIIDGKIICFICVC